LGDLGSSVNGSCRDALVLEFPAGPLVRADEVIE
jgi:hypothetical protein